MAIIRCPYCHAIIDETAKYCNNCGTQLLFPDDETLEEEIPGEKIIDADIEEKDYELDEPEEEAVALEEEYEEEGTGEDDDRKLELEERQGEGRSGRDDEEIEKEDIKTERLIVEPEGEDRIAAGLEKELEKEKEEGHEEETGTQKMEAEESPRPDEIEEEEAEEEEREEKIAGEEEIFAKRLAEAPPAGDGSESVADLETAEVEYIKDSGVLEESDLVEKPSEKTPAEEETATAEVEIKPKDTFDTRDLDNIGRTVDLGKERIDRFLEVMAEKEKEALEEEEARSGPRPPEKSDTGGTLPPWADAMVGAPSFDSGDKTDTFPPGWEKGDLAEEELAPEAGTAEEEPEAEKEERILPRRRASDSGIGYPERLTQPVLPFGETPEEEEPGEEFLRPGVTESEEEGVLPPFNLTDFVKAKAFDCLFLGLLWLITSWFAARSMDTTLFRLFSSSGGLLLALYLILLVMYFFLFQFFLGETLGDRIFRRKG